MRLRGMASEIDETSIPVSKLRDVIKQLTASAGKEVDIMLDENTFKSTYQQMTELAEVYPKLTDGQRAYLQYVIAGQRQGNIFSGIMQNMTEGIDAYNTALNSSGSAQREQELYLDSIEGKINAFKETLTGLWVDTISSDSIKSIVSGGTTLLNVLSQISSAFGALPTVLSIASTAFVMFNKNARELGALLMNDIPGISFLQGKLTGLETNLRKQIVAIKNNINAQMEWGASNKAVGASTSGLGASLTGLNIKLALTKAQLIATKVASLALQSALSFGLSLLVTGAISKFMEFADSVAHADEKLKEFNDEFASSMKNDSNVNASDLLNNYKTIASELENVQKGTEEYTQKEQELKSAMDELISVYPDAITYIDEDTNKKLLNVDATEKLINKNLELAKSKANKVLDKNNVDADTNGESINKLIEDYEKANEQLKIYNQLKVEGKTWYKDEEGGIHLVSGGLKSTTKEVENYQSSINALLPALKMFKDDNSNLGEAYRVLNDYINQSTKAINDNTEAKQSNSNATVGDMGSGVKADPFVIQTKIMEESLASLGLKAEEVKEKMSKIDVGDLGSAEYIKTATEAYVNATSEVDSLYQMVNKLNDAQSMTPELITTIAGKYPEIGSAIFSTAETQEFLNNKISAMESIQSEAYQIMVGNDQNYYNSLLQNADNLQQQFNQYASDFIDVNSEAYDFDVRNYSTLNEAKAALTQQLNPVLAQWLSNLVGGSASSYEQDLANFTSLAQQKAYVLQKLDENIAKVQSNYDNLITRTKSMSSLMPKGGKNEFLNKELSKRMGLDFLNEELTNVGNQLDNLKSERQKIETSFSEFNKGFSSSAPNFSASDYKGSGGGGKGGSGGGGSKKDSAATEKQVEDIGSLADRYYELEGALTKVESAITRLNTEKQNADDKEKIKLLEQEISLINDKAKALQNLYDGQNEERLDFKRSLKSAGFTFDDATDGGLLNYQKRLDEILNWANSQTDADTKQNAQEYYKNIVKMADEYQNLIKKTMPATLNQIKDIKNETISAQKEIANILKKQVDDYKKKEEEKTEKVKKELQRQKDMINRAWKKEDEADELAEKQKKLDQLNADLTSALRTGDESLAYSIRQQIKEAQKELNDFINQAERDAINQRFDDETNKVDEDLKAKLDEIEKQLSDEDILGMVQAGIRDLSEVLGNIDKSTNGVNSSFVGVSDTVNNIGGIISDTWLTSMDKMIDKVKELVNIFPTDMSLGLGFNGISPINKPSATNSIKIDMGGINLEGITKEELDREFDKAKDEVYRTINKNLNR